MNKKIFFLFPFFILLANNTWSQNIIKPYNFVSVKDDLSKVGIHTAQQDNYGFIWLGTHGTGLYRYDGLNYKPYKYIINDSTSLSSNIVFTTYLDSKNRMWVGTEKGLNLYDRNHDRFIRISNFNNLDNKNISVSCLHEDDSGNLFIGTLEFGLFIMDTVNFTIKKVLSDESLNALSLNVNSIKKNRFGKIFIATDRGLKTYDNNTQALVQAKISTQNSKEDYLNTSIKSLIIDEQNTIWAGSESEGLFRISENQQLNSRIEKLNYSLNTFLSLKDLKNGTILCGTENDGLLHLRYDGSLIKHYIKENNKKRGILSNSIWSILLDNDNRIWLGYYNKGISVHDKMYDKFNEIESASNLLKHSSVTAFEQDDSNKLWIATDGGGINVLDKSTNTFTYINPKSTDTYSGLTSNYIESLFIDSRKNIWAGSWGNGIYLLKKNSKKFKNFNPSNTNKVFLGKKIMTIAEDKNGNVWFGSYNNGLFSYNPKKNSFKHHNSEIFLKHNLVNSEIRKLIVDHNNHLWLASTTEGLFKIDISDTDDIKIKSISNSMPQDLKKHNSFNNVLSLFQGSDKTIWIGTRGAGLCKYNDKTNSFQWYNKLNGLEEENINGIIESNNHNIWLAGNLGITKLDVNKNSFISYSKNDGLLSNDYNINSTFKDKKGVLYFGNFLGVDYFNPKNIVVNNRASNIYLTDFKIFNKSSIPNQNNSPLKKVISKTNHLILKSSQSVFTIEYSSINYTRPEKNQYAYYLEGYEDAWNYVGNKRNATYTNLDAGDYIFKLKSANNDGVWNDTPLLLKISILPPLWKTPLAITLYILMFLFGLYLLNKITKARLKEKQLVEAERNNRLLEKELNEKKLQFFTNISHEFRTPLSLILSPLEDIIKNHSSNLPDNLKNKHNTIHKNTHRLFRLINELIDFRRLDLNKVKIKVKPLNLVTFTKNIISHFREEASIKNIHLSLDTDIQEIEVWADESMLEKIIFNILSNAFKVTPDGGAITVDLSSRDDLVKLPLATKKEKIKGVEISISDTGPGLTKSQVDKIFNRFYKVDNLNNTYYGGTGIGLEVVQNFVTLHKGKIKVKSEPKQGTTFRVILPAKKKYFKKNEILQEETIQTLDDNKASLPIIKTAVEIKENTDNSSLKHTLLIVEDNTELRNYLKNEFKSQYKILLAKNGKEGLDIAKKNFPDVIITDVIMPEMDGFSFCKQIKTDIKTSHIPLLMLTAKTQVENRMQGIENGADAYMAKPFDVGLLKLRLSQLITSRQLIFNKYFSIIGDSDNKNATSLDKEFIEKVMSYINKNISDSNLNVESLASHLNLSRSQFYRKIKALTNQTANEFIRNIRLMKAKQIIESGKSNISEVCYNVGFSSPSYFTKCFKSHFGVLPKEVESKNS